jgi:hypothetical protein
VATINDDRLRYADLLEFLTNGPVGERRRWAAMLVLRMLEATRSCRYRSEDRLGGVTHAQAALASLQAAMAVLSRSEQGLLLRTALMVSWEQLRRYTGLSLRLPGILAALGEHVGKAICLTAVQSVFEKGEDAVRLYPLAGLLPELRQPGDGIIITLGARERQQLGISAARIEIDRLTAAVQSFRGSCWEANLRPLAAWWLETMERGEADRAAGGLFSDIRRAAEDEQARWRALGLLDWLADHPDHPRAGEAMTVAREVARSDVRKAAADLAAALGQWEVLEGLARGDRDRGVRQRAEKLLTGRSGPGASGGQGEISA